MLYRMQAGSLYRTARQPQGDSDMASYIGYLRKHDSAGYRIEFPDFPECDSTAQRLEHVGVMGAEDLLRHVAALVSFGLPVPPPHPWPSWPTILGERGVTWSWLNSISTWWRTRRYPGTTTCKGIVGLLHDDTTQPF
jgi:predicted RNase H-like HicB family nuclease